MTYRVARAYLDDPLSAAALRALAYDCFEPGTLQLNARQDPGPGAWWLVWHDNDAVAFAGMKLSVLPHGHYISLMGTLPQHRGHGLQRRLLSRCIQHARNEGSEFIVTETIHDNVVSGNNMIRAGFRMFTPPYEWNPKAPCVYWRKDLT